jgi:hypothetical protein
MNRRAMQLQTTDFSEETNSTTDTTAAAVAATEAAQLGQNRPKRHPARRVAADRRRRPKPRTTGKGKPPQQARSGASKRATKKHAGRKRAAQPAAEARDGSKKAIILDLRRRPKGATLGELMKATKWQAHSIRGFIAGPLKRGGITVGSNKSEAGERKYRIAK